MYNQKSCWKFNLKKCFYIAILQAFILHLNCEIKNDLTLIDLKSNRFYDGKVLNVPIGIDAVIQLYQRWLEQAYSGLLAAIASQKIKKVSKKAQKDLKICSKSSNNIIQHAKCVQSLLNYNKKKSNHNNNQLNDNSLNKLSLIEKSSNRLKKYKTKKCIEKKIGKRNANTELIDSKKKIKTPTLQTKFINQDKYNLLDRNSELSMFGAVARGINKILMVSKNKTHLEQWDMTVSKLQEISKNKKIKQKQQQKQQQKLKKKQLNSENDEIDDFGFRGLNTDNVKDISDIIDHPKKLKKLIEASNRHISNITNNDPNEKILRLSNFIRQGVKLGFTLAGENTKDFDNKTLRLISPRFLSVVPEDMDNNTLNVLSPSLFSMHNEGAGIEKNISLPSLLKSFNRNDQTQWLNLIMEASGVNDQTENLEKKEAITDNKTTSINMDLWNNVRKSYNTEIRGKDGQPMYFVKKNVTDRYGSFETSKIDIFESLIKSYSSKQLKQLNETGYAILTSDQLKLLYGPNSPYYHAQTLKRLLPLNSTMINYGIEADVHRTAEMSSFQLRQKDVTLSPIISSPILLAGNLISQPVILSPLVLSPVILTPAVLGPIILSPWVFVPVILSPRVLSPLIVNPLIFSPIILSPLILHPLILSPGIFNPIILSPLVLSPFILSPQVFTPIILSPLVLNPLILNPMVGSPLILSPFVLSPLILSPQVLFALVLSPYALSPLIETKLIVSSLILSPSWLS